jgi:hypothetical protein
MFSRVYTELGQWLMPVIVATVEAEIWRVTV